MLAQGSIPIFTQFQQRSIVFVGMATVIIAGLVACIALTLSLLWFVVHLALLTLQASIETLNAIGATFNTADALVKFLLIVATGYAAYQIYRKVTRKEATR